MLHVAMYANQKRAKTHTRSARRRTHTQNAFRAWVIFAFKRVRTQTFRSKTFRMYYTSCFIFTHFLIGTVPLLFYQLPKMNKKYPDITQAKYLEKSIFFQGRIQGGCFGCSSTSLNDLIHSFVSAMAGILYTRMSRH